MKHFELSGALLEFAEIGEFDLVRSILDVLLSDTQNKIDSLELTNDLPMARRLAHSLKGSLRQVGISGLADKAEELENTTADLTRAEFADIVRGIAEGWGEARVSVAQIRDALPASACV